MIKKHWRKSLKKRLEVNALVLPTLHKSTFFFSSHLSVALRGFLVFPGCLFPTSWDLSEWWMAETLPATVRFKPSARWVHVAMKLIESSRGQCMVSPPGSASHDDPVWGPLGAFRKAGGKKSQQMGKCSGELSSACRAGALRLALEQEFCRYLVVSFLRQTKLLYCFPFQ